MVDKGASGTDAELEQIITYLSTNYRRRPATVNVNTAAGKDLELDLGFTKSDAEAIEQYRQSNGKFKSLDDLKNVPKIDAAKIEAEKNRITF
jgi:competence protein ComEA